MFGFFTLLLDLNVNGEHCGQSLNKKIPRDVEKVGLPIQKRFFLLSSNIQIFNDKKSES
jgi:hypothetical protein